MNDSAQNVLVVIGVAVIMIVLICFAAVVGLAVFSNVSLVPTPTFPIPLT